MFHLNLTHYSRRAILLACLCFLLISVGAAAAAYEGGGKRSEFDVGSAVKRSNVGADNNSPASPLKADGYHAGEMLLMPQELSPQVLFVVGSTTLIAGDAAVKSRLEGLGFTVAVKDAPSSVTADATGRALVVISESVIANDVGIKFRDVAVPVMVMEAGLYDDMMLTGPTVGTDYDTWVGQSQVVITDTSHPMAAGMTGNVAPTTAATAYSWGIPGASAVKVAALATSASRYALFGYERGAAMVGMSAPARRVGIFLWKDTPTFLNTDGWALFDAAVRWDTTLPPQALFVVGSTMLIAGDAAIKSRLEGLGFIVTVKDAPSSVTADATGKALVVISESVTAIDVGAKFRDVAVPVVTLEAGLFDDMMLTGPTVGTDYDNWVGQSQVTITDSSHPMAGGLSGTVTVTTSATALAWGRPGAGAVKVASLATDGTRYALFGYETGASMFNGMSAPARRAGMFLWKDTPTFLNASGWTLFDAAVRWIAPQQVVATQPYTLPHSLSLNGTDAYVNVPYSSSLNIMGPITVEAWFKRNPGGNQSIVERYGPSSGGYAVRIESDRLCFYTLNNSSDFDRLVGNTTVTTGVWHHVAAVFDGSRKQIFLDGLLDGSAATTFGPGAGTANLRIGVAGESNTNFFSGLIDEVRVTAGVRYASSFIPDLAQAADGSDTRGLWNFDAQTANDSSGKDNHGTFVGGVYCSSACAYVDKKSEWLTAQAQAEAADQPVKIDFDLFAHNTVITT
jgi:hypothetical protein